MAAMAVLACATAATGNEQSRVREQAGLCRRGPDVRSTSSIGSTATVRPGRERRSIAPDLEIQRLVNSGRIARSNREARLHSIAGSSRFNSKALSAGSSDRGEGHAHSIRRNRASELPGLG
jgi:hypothetical protein